MSNAVNPHFGSVVYKVNQYIGGGKKEDSISLRPWDGKQGQIFNGSKLIGNSPHIALYESIVTDYWKDTGIEEAFNKADVVTPPIQEGAADWRYNKLQYQQLCEQLESAGKTDVLAKVKAAVEKQENAKMVPTILTWVAEALPKIKFDSQADWKKQKQFKQYLPTLQGLLKGESSVGEMQDHNNLFTRVHIRTKSAVDSN